MSEREVDARDDETGDLRLTHAGVSLCSPAPIGPESRTSDVVRAAITASVARILAADPLIRTGQDPEAVHQARVATRRLRSDLRTFRPFVDQSWADGLRDDLRVLAGALGAVRDRDVLVADLEALLARVPPASSPAAARVLDRLAQERDDAHHALLAEMSTVHYAALLDRLVDAANAPRFSSRADAAARDVLPRRVRTPWRRLRRAVRTLDAGTDRNEPSRETSREPSSETRPEPSDEALHHVRILTKRCRYAVEAVAPVAGKRARRLARRLADLQDVLGAQHDAVVARAWLAGAATDLDRDATFAAGILTGLVVDEERQRRRRWRRAWRRASARRLRGWW